MTTLTIPDVANDIAARLRTRAAANGRSIEAEARSILSDVLGADAEPVPEKLGDAIRAIMAPLGGIELEPFPDQPVPEPVRFD